MVSILSLVTSVKDYVEIVHKLIETDSNFKIFDYSDFGPIITYILICLKKFCIDFLSLNWLKSLWDFPIIVPDISSAMISEISVLDGYFHNTFNFLDKPISYQDHNIIIHSLEKFSVGLINSLFLCLPTATTHIIVIRRFLIQGLEAGYLAGLGSIFGNLLWISSVVFGWRFIIIPWLSLDIFRYLLGFVLLVKYMWESYGDNQNKVILTKNKIAGQKIFLLSFLLTLTEQTSIYPFITNISIGSESSILEGFSAENYSEFFFIHGSYILGLTVGCLSLLHFSCWFWENPAFKIYMWVISSFKVSTTLYYKMLNLTFLYLTMICAISSIPYYGLDYTLTNPLGFVQDDRLLDQKLILETSFINSKASDRNTRRNRGRHGRRERWKRRIRKYRTFDASLYDQGIYDLFTIEDLNYGFDRFWLRRKMRNHRVRFRFFPGPWMRSFKKQLAKPRLESYAGPREEFFRILFEQVYHPSFHEYDISKIDKVGSPPAWTLPTMQVRQEENKSKETMLASTDLLFLTWPSESNQLALVPPRVEYTHKVIDTFNSEQGIGFERNKKNKEKTFYNYKESKLTKIFKKKKNLKIENSTLRKFVRKLNNRLKQAEINLNFNIENLNKFREIENNAKTLMIQNELNNNNLVYSKRWKEIFSKISHNFDFKNSNQGVSFKTFLAGFKEKEEKTKKENSRINLSKYDKQILKYRSMLTYANKNTENPDLGLNSPSLNLDDLRMGVVGSTWPAGRGLSKSEIIKNNDWKTLNSIGAEKNMSEAPAWSVPTAQAHITSPWTLLHPLKYYLKKEQAFNRKLRYYTPTIFRKFSIENNAPYFRVMMRRYFYYFKPTLRWERTMKVASLRKARRKTSVSPRKIPFSSLSSSNQIENDLSNIVNLDNQINKINVIDIDIERKNRKVKPTDNYTIVGKRASRFRYQIYKDVLQHWYYSPFNRLLLKLDIDLFISRQPNSHFLTKNEEKLLHLRRFLLAEHYDTLRWYSYMQHYRSMKTKIGGTKSFSNKVYNQQFSGTFKKIRHLFAITPSQNDQTILKFDQPLYNESFNNSRKNLQKNLIIHEELLNKFLIRESDLSWKLPPLPVEEKLAKLTWSNDSDLLPTRGSHYHPHSNASPPINNGLDTEVIEKQGFAAYDKVSPSSETKKHPDDRGLETLIDTLSSKDSLSSETYSKFINKELIFSEKNSQVLGGDLLTQSTNIIGTYLKNSKPIKEEFIKNLIQEKNYLKLTLFLYKGQKTRGVKPILNNSQLLNQEKNYLLTNIEKDEFTSLEKIKLNNILYSLQEDLSISFLKKWKRKVNDQEFLKNYLQRRLEKKRNQKKQVNLKTKLKRLESWVKGYSLDSTFYSTELASKLKPRQINDALTIPSAIEESQGDKNKATDPLFREQRRSPQPSQNQGLERLRESGGTRDQASREGKTINIFDDKGNQSKKSFFSFQLISNPTTAFNNALSQGTDHAGTFSFKKNQKKNIKNASVFSNKKEKQLLTLVKSLNKIINLEKVPGWTVPTMQVPCNNEITFEGSNVNTSSSNKSCFLINNKKQSSRRFLIINLRRKIKNFSTIYKSRLKKLILINSLKLISIFKPIKKRKTSFKSWQKIERSLNKQKRSRKEFKLFSKKTFGAETANHQGTVGESLITGNKNFTSNNYDKYLDKNSDFSLSNFSKKSDFSFNENSSFRKKRDFSVANDSKINKNLIPSSEIGLEMQDRQSEWSKYLNNYWQNIKTLNSFKTKKSPLRRARTRRNRGVTKKRTLSDSLKREFKILQKYNQNQEQLNQSTGSALKLTSSLSIPILYPIYQEFNKNSVLNENKTSFFSFQPRSKQKKQRFWKQKRSKYSQRLKKYKKRRRSIQVKIRVLNKQLKRVQSSTELRNWWWKNFLPNLRATTDSLLQIEKERQIEQKLEELTVPEILKRDRLGQTSNNLIIKSTLALSPTGLSDPAFKNNNKNSELNENISNEEFSLNNLQIGDFDFKPLSMPEALRLREKKNSSNAAFLNPSNNQYLLNNTSNHDISHSLHTELLLNKNDIISTLSSRILLNQKPTDLILPGDNLSPWTQYPTQEKITNSNIKLALINNVPFYAGWDESLRKFIVTNRLLSRRTSGYSTNSLLKKENHNSKQVYPPQAISSFEKEESKTFFSETPLKGMNAATTLYWQIPFTTYDPDQFFALGMDGFAPLGWRRFQFRHSILKSWLIERENSLIFKKFIDKSEKFNDKSKDNKSLAPQKQNIYISDINTNKNNKNNSNNKNLLNRIYSSTLEYQNSNFNLSNIKTITSNHPNITNRNESKIYQSCNFYKPSNPFFTSSCSLRGASKPPELTNLGRTNPTQKNKKSVEQAGLKISIKNTYRRLKKRYKRVKKHPRSPVWFPSGPLLNQVLPVHYIYIFYKRARLPRDRYIKRRLKNSKAIQKDMSFSESSSSNLFFNKDFTLRKRVKTKRKYHIKQNQTSGRFLIPRRLKFIQDNNSEIRWRPLSRQKLNKPITELIKEQRALKDKQRKKEQALKNNSSKQGPNLRVKQVRRRVQRQIIRSVWRYKPRAGGFVWPGDYLKLEQVKTVKLKSSLERNNYTLDQGLLDKNLKSTSLKVKRKKKQNIQEWQIQPKKYLLEKHNLNIIKKKLEKANRLN